jgi:endonuclease/exonuclease/phosphatase (EEP) superfamily protein YafD
MPSFSLLTFNTFAILSWDTIFRINALSLELARLRPDIICLQEIHQHGFRHMLTRANAYHIDAVHAPQAGRPRGGLLTLSRLRNQGHEFIPFVEQGPWYTLELMDRLLNKGLLLTRYRLEGLDLILLNTHILANYGANYARSGGAAQRQAAQLRQLHETVAGLPADALVVVVGDFNLPRGSWLYHEFLDAGGLEDTLADDLRPTYRPLPGVPARYALPIDFVFVRRPTHLPVHFSSTLTLDQPVLLFGNYRNFLSDHIGILTEFFWSPVAPPSNPNDSAALT